MNEVVPVSPNLPARDLIMRLQNALLAMPQPEMPTFHHFADGLYGRELHIPKGVCLVGRVHMKAQLNILLKGDMSVFSEDGMKRMKAPCVFVSSKGVKRAGYAHEDSIWVTVLATDKKDEQEIFDTLTALDYDEYEKRLLEEKKGD